jgi:transmembrane sensor
VAAAAAAVILTILPQAPERDTPTHALFPVESSSSSGDITTLGLSDGSILRMMPATRVEFPATADHREVVVEGKAFFAVTPAPVPFVVQTEGGEISVHGTRFEVQTNGAELRVVVVEGQVTLKGQMGSVQVGSGQIAYANRISPPRVMDHQDLWSLLEWPGGLLVYEGTPLSEVARELSRHFGAEVVLSNDALGSLRITAWFEDESLEEVISAVCLVASVSCQVSEEAVRIGG